VLTPLIRPSYRILYLAPLVPEENALFRFWALQRPE
jgi:hypothetical protein